MGVLDGMTDVDEEPQPFTGGKVALVAVLGDRDALDKLHYEVRAGRFRSLLRRGPWRD